MPKAAASNLSAISVSMIVLVCNSLGKYWAAIVSEQWIRSQIMHGQSICSTISDFQHEENADEDEGERATKIHSLSCLLINTAFTYHVTRKLTVMLC